MGLEPDVLFDMPSLEVDRRWDALLEHTYMQVSPFIRYHLSKMGGEEALRKARSEHRDEPTPLMDELETAFFAPYMSEMRRALNAKEPDIEPFDISLGAAVGLRELITRRDLPLPGGLFGRELYDVWERILKRAGEAN